MDSISTNPYSYQILRRCFIYGLMFWIALLLTKTTLTNHIIINWVRGLILTLFSWGIDHFHDGVISLLRPEFIAILYYYENFGYCCFMLSGITGFEYERENAVNSGLSSKMTPSCKWPIVALSRRPGDKIKNRETRR